MYKYLQFYGGEGSSVPKQLAPSSREHFWQTRERGEGCLSSVWYGQSFTKCRMEIAIVVILLEVNPGGLGVVILASGSRPGSMDFFRA